MGYYLRMLGQTLYAAVFPGISQFRGVKVSPAVAWTIHVILLILTLVLLYFIHQWWHLRRSLLGYPGWVRELWLPILFLLLYVLFWLGWWLYILIVAEQDPTQFPDIDEAWDEAVKAMARASIDVRRRADLPGAGPAGGPLDAVFQAARMKWVVRQTPSRADAPVQVWATQEAVYVTCVGASLLGRHVSRLVGELGDGAGPAPVGGGEEYMTVGNMTIQFDRNKGGAMSDIKAIMDRARKEGRDLTRDERRQVRALIRKDRAADRLLSNQEETARYRARTGTSAG